MPSGRARRLALAFLVLAGSAAASAQPAPEDPAPPLADELLPQTASFPDASLISLAWQGDGRTRVVGRPGAVHGRSPVLALCANSGAAAFVLSADDGSFEAELVALPGAWVIVKHDPAASSFAGSRWLNPPPAGQSIGTSMFAGSNAPGVWLRLAPEAAPPGEGAAFAVSGLTQGGGVDFSLIGRMRGAFEPGGSVDVEGAVSVFASSAAAPALLGRSVRFDADIGPLFDAAGRARLESGFYFSNIMTPTGLPVQTKGDARFSARDLLSGPLVAGPGGRFTAPVRWTLPIPSSAPAGTYAVWLQAKFEGQPARLGRLRENRQIVLTREQSALPAFTVGTPAAPRLTWTLLTDVPGADGSRGVAAEQDHGDFDVASGVVIQSRAYIVPRLSKRTGEPLAYRLEPYLPMVSQGDRLVPNPPPIDFAFPSGSLTVRVHRPDGKTDALGPAAFAGARSRSPATPMGAALNGNSGSLTDVFQLTTATPAFDYRFPADGRYVIEVSGEVKDVHGNAYAGGGRYVVFAAERLDLEPAVLPMTPLQVGDALNPGLTVLPGVPAEVEVTFRHLPDSDPRRAVQRTFKGRANRFGVYAPKAGERPFVVAEPGEFVVEVLARYVDAAGVPWMGTLRWGQVVETPGAPLLARGRRGRVRMTHPAASLWFYSSRTTDGGHLRYPYASGDVAWQSDDDSLIPSLSVHDREGLVRKALDEAFRTGPDCCYLLEQEGRLEDRFRANELPLPLVSDGPLSPASDPAGIRLHGYFYAGAERPGERVREAVSDDQGVQTQGYWFFDEPYAMQPGVGLEGDLPNDFKFIYGGAVFRDARTGLRRYGVYGALWINLGADDVLGGRVFPPFDGAHGGPRGGPLMVLGGERVDGFLVPLAARPGTILETGGTFSFSAAVAPTLPASVEAVVTGPRGFRRTIAGRANAVGYFYRPEQDFTVSEPGVYRVAAAATFDVETSAGRMRPPFPTGSVLGAKRTFNVYVVDRKSPALKSGLPFRSVVRGLGPAALAVEVPPGLKGTLHYTIAMPGFQLAEGSFPAEAGAASVPYDPVALHGTFPNIDVEGLGRGAGPLADTVWASVMLEGTDGRHHARSFTLQGPELYAP